MNLQAIRITVMWLMVAALISLEIPAAWGMEPLTAFKQGEINWSTGEVTASGYFRTDSQAAAASGPDPAVTLARTDAQTRLLETLQDIRISANLTVRDIMSRKPELVRRIRRTIREAPVIRQTHLPDGSLQVTIRFSLFGDFAQLILPESIEQVGTIHPVASSRDVQKANPKNASGDGSPQPYTGLILDARGLDTRPALTINVLDENGKPAYGTAFVSREFVVQRGMCGYMTVGDGIAPHPRVGKNPMIVKVLRSIGEAKTNIVISNMDAARLRGTVAHLAFLKQCRVLVILDPRDGP